MQLHRFLFAVLVLIGCTNKPADKVVFSEKTDALHAEQVASKTVDVYFNNPTRDLNNFAVKVNCEPIDSLNKLFTTYKNVQIVTKTNLCGGDCCISFKKMTDRKSNTTFCFFKIDRGEYGFSNEQFFFVDHKLSIFRSFDLGIEEWPSDSTPTLWSIEEKIILFNNDKAIIRERKKTSTDNTNFTFHHIPFQETIGDIVKLTQEKTEDYNNLLATENTEE